jgi:hypothetical protein
METISLMSFRSNANTEAQGKSCPIIPIEERKNASFWKQTLMFFFRFGVCPMCMTSSITYSLYELVRFRRIRVEKSVWSDAVTDSPRF